MMKDLQRRFFLWTVITLVLCGYGCTTIASEVMADTVDTKPDSQPDDSNKAAWGVQHNNNNNNNNNNKDTTNNNNNNMDKSENVNQSATTTTTTTRTTTSPPPSSDKIPFVPPPKEGNHKVDEKHTKPLHVVGGTTTTSSTSTSSSSSTTTTTGSPSFLSSQSQKIPLEPHHNPPEGFQITARVYTDPDDTKAHFDSETQVTLPYLDCGAVGSTTDPLLVKHALFRHALGGPTTPSVWSGSEYGPHPQLLIPLAKLELTVNSGESRVFQAGDVILLEDVLTDGHKIKTPTEEQFEYLLLTLPQHYHHVGKDRVSLMGTTKTRLLNNNPKNPCPLGDHPTTSSSSYHGGSGDDGKSVTAFVLPSTRRKVVLGCVGGVLGVKLVEVLVKVAPLWLSVGFGGMGLILTTIYGFVHGGEWCYENVDLWLEKRRLERQADDEEEDDPEDENDLSSSSRIEFDHTAATEKQMP